MEKPSQNLKKRLRMRRRRIESRVRRAEGSTQRHARRFILQRLDNVRLVMGEITIWLVVIALLIAGLGVQFGWSASGYTQEGEKNGGTFVEGIVGNIDTLNPLLASSAPENAAAKLLFSSLYSYDNSGKIHTELATGTTIRDDKIYTVKLRDANWSDGQKITAEDVVFTVGLIKNPQLRSPLRVNWRDVSVRAVDSSTVEFTLPAAYAGFFHALTFPVVPKHVLKDVDPANMRESNFSNNPTGSGRFVLRLKQVSGGDSSALQLAANENYFGQTPKIARFELRTYGDEQALTRAVENGEVSAAIGLSSAATDIRSRQYDTHFWRTNSGIYLLMNNDSVIFSNQKTRLALRYATDTDEIRDAVGGEVLRLDTPILQEQISDELPVAPDPDMEKAKSLLREAGWNFKNDKWVDEAGRELVVTITTASGREDYRKIFASIEKQWRALGLNVQLREVDTSSVSTSFLQSVLRPRDYDILLYELELGADPDEFAYWHSSQKNANGYNFANYSNRAADTNLLTARSRLEMNLRSVKYVQFARQWLADAPAIGLYQSTTSYVVNRGVKIVEPTGSLNSLADHYADIENWSVNSASVYKTP